MPEAASAVRRHLSGIMLDYPVLLHPSILLPSLRSNGSQTEYTSLASALACTPHAGLARYSHFRSRAQDKEGGIDEALLDRLTAFAKHPCVRLAFDSAAVRIRLAPQTQGVRHRPIRKTKETLLRSLTGSTGQRVEFLGSVMELDELGGQHNGQLVRPFWSNVKADRPMLGLLDAMIAASIAAASGIVHVAASQGSIPTHCARISQI